MIICCLSRKIQFKGGWIDGSSCWKALHAARTEFNPLFSRVHSQFNPDYYEWSTLTRILSHWFKIHTSVTWWEYTALYSNSVALKQHQLPLQKNGSLFPVSVRREILFLSILLFLTHFFSRWIHKSTHYNHYIVTSFWTLTILPGYVSSRRKSNLKWRRRTHCTRI